MENYKEKLRLALEEFWRKELPELKERDIKLDLETDLINDVVGIRRAGKTSVMLLSISKLGRDKCLYINFENRKLFPLTDQYFNAIIELIYAKQMLNKFEKIYLFLDEVQNIKGWEKYVRSIYDEFQGKIKIIVSGSTSKLTKSKLSTLLTGRHLTSQVFPLSFSEFLSFKNFKIPNFFTEEDKALIMELLREYITFGGFPEIVLNNKKQEMIETLMLDIINRDVLPNIQKRKDIVEDFVYFLCSNSGRLLSFNKIAKLFRKTSVVTVEKIFKLLKDVFLFFDIYVYSYSVKDQLQHPRKILCIDSGFINHFGFKFSQDKGRLIENIVGIELLRRFSMHRKTSVYYWKDYQQREVDFVVKEGLNVKQLIQVTYASAMDEVNNREIKSLLKASELFKCKDLLVITWDYEAEEEIKNKKIRFTPLWNWLLGRDIN